MSFCFYKKNILCCFCLLVYIHFIPSWAQRKDTVSTTNNITQSISKDSVTSNVSIQTIEKEYPIKYNNKHTVTAGILSAILPGAGQIYNKTYFRAVAYVGLLTYYGFQFKQNYDIYQLSVKGVNAYDKITLFKDSSDYKQLIISDPKLMKNERSTLANFRDNSRREMDQQILFMVLFYALNICDAIVFAHLKTFEVSDNLSMRIKPQFDLRPNMRPYYGLGLVFNIHDSKHKQSPKTYCPPL